MTAAEGFMAVPKTGRLREAVLVPVLLGEVAEIVNAHLARNAPEGSMPITEAGVKKWIEDHASMVDSAVIAAVSDEMIEELP